MDTIEKKGYTKATKTKSGRLDAKTSKEKKNRAYILFCKGTSQRDISLQIGVGEKTVGNWVKAFRYAQKIDTDTIVNLKLRLFEMSTDKTTPIADYVSLLLVIEQLEGN